MAELDAAGVFRKKTDGANSKKGTVNTVAGEATDSDSGGGGTGDANTEETAASTLTDPTEALWSTTRSSCEPRGTAMPQSA